MVQGLEAVARTLGVLWVRWEQSEGSEQGVDVISHI